MSRYLPMDGQDSLPCSRRCNVSSGSISAELRERLSGQTEELSLERGFYQIADEFTVDGLTGQPGHDCFHDLTHVLW